MKKFAIFCSVVALLGMASCDDKSDLGVAQVNEQQTVLSAGGVTITPQAPFSGNTLSLQNATDATVYDVLTYTTKEALPAGAYMEFRMELAKDAAYAAPVEINLTRPSDAKAAYTVTAEELNNAIYELYGKAPVERPVYTRVAAYIVNGTTLIRIRENDEAAWFMAKTIQMTPTDVNLDIESTYYFMDSLAGMSLANAQVMSHSEKHEYDDPIFSFVIDVTANDVASSNVTWAIAPKSAVESGDMSKVYGAEAGAELTAMTGGLEQGGVYLEFDAPAKYQVRVNMMDKTYEVGFANEQLYIWTPQLQFRSYMGLHTYDYISYSGVGYIGGVWKLTGQPDMMSLQIGKGGADGELAFGKTTSPIALPEGGAGLYKIDANLSEMTYNVVHAETLGVVGGNNNWGNLPADAPEGTEAPKDTPLVDITANHNVWSAEVTFADENNLQFKIRANNSWGSDDAPSFDFGQDNGLEVDGNKIPLSFGGSNLSVPGVGTYVITVDFSLGSTVGAPLPYYVTIEAK